MNVQMVILQNQHSGKDTHIRQVKIFGPREYNLHKNIFLIFSQGNSLKVLDSLSSRVQKFYNITLSDKLMLNL